MSQNESLARNENDDDDDDVVLVMVIAMRRQTIVMTNAMSKIMIVYLCFTSLRCTRLLTFFLATLVRLQLHYFAG